MKRTAACVCEVFPVMALRSILSSICQSISWLLARSPAQIVGIVNNSHKMHSVCLPNASLRHIINNLSNPLHPPTHPSSQRIIISAHPLPPNSSPQPSSPPQTPSPDSPPPPTVPTPPYSPSQIHKSHTGSPPPHKTPSHTSAPSSNYASVSAEKDGAQPETAIPHARSPDTWGNSHPSSCAASSAGKTPSALGRLWTWRSERG